MRDDGHLSREWLRGSWAESLDGARALGRARARPAAAAGGGRPRAARPARDARRHAAALPRRTVGVMAALLCVELEARRPADRPRGARGDARRPRSGPRPRSEAEEAAARRARDQRCGTQFPGEPVDLRNPAYVRDLLARIGIDVPDTRSWRLEPYAESSPGVAALLPWRKAERIATTYGWRWVERDIGDDDRLRGVWGAGEGAGRMTASAGLHNLPAELRPAVRPRPGPRARARRPRADRAARARRRVAATRALAAAAREDDMYAPVAAALGSDRPTAKVAVLAAMYGQTSGPAGAALKDMDRAYPTAMAFLRARRGLRPPRRRPAHLRRPAAAALGARGGARGGRGSESTLAHAYGRFARNAVVQGAAAELFKAWAATVRAGLVGARRADRAVPARRAARGDAGRARGRASSQVVEALAAVDGRVVVRGQRRPLRHRHVDRGQLGRGEVMRSRPGMAE